MRCRDPAPSVASLRIHSELAETRDGLKPRHYTKHVRRSNLTRITKLPGLACVAPSSALRAPSPRGEKGTAQPRLRGEGDAAMTAGRPRPAGERAGVRGDHRRKRLDIVKSILRACLGVGILTPPERADPTIVRLRPAFASSPPRCFQSRSNPRLHLREAILPQDMRIRLHRQTGRA
jgi:hypothetical protein